MATLLEKLDSLTTEQFKAMVVELCLNGQSDLVVSIMNRWEASSNAQGSERESNDGTAEAAPSAALPARRFSKDYSTVPASLARKRKREAAEEPVHRGQSPEASPEATRGGRWSALAEFSDIGGGATNQSSLNDESDSSDGFDALGVCESDGDIDSDIKNEDQSSDDY